MTHEGLLRGAVGVEVNEEDLLLASDPDNVFRSDVLELAIGQGLGGEFVERVKGPLAVVLVLLSVSIAKGAR